MLKFGLFALIHGFPINWLYKHLNLKLRAPKGKTVTLVAAQSFPEKTSILVSEWHPTPQPSSQLPNPSSSLPDYSAEAVSEGFSFHFQFPISALSLFPISYNLQF